MVRVKEKKAKGDDAFTTRKQKVGRKKLAPATATKAEVHARTLRITAPHQALQTPAQVQQAMIDEKEAKRPPKTFKEEMAGAMHYRAPTKRGAFTALAKIVSGEAKDVAPCSPVQILQLLNTSLENLCDNEREVRDGVELSLNAIVENPENLTGPAPATIVRNLLIVLTHANGGVRKAGIRFLGHVLRSAPGCLSGLLSSQASVAAGDMNVEEDLRTLVQHIAQLAPKGSYHELSLILKELEGTILTDLGFVNELYDSLIDFFATSWKECMELRYGLFRKEHALHHLKACSIAECFFVLVPPLVTNKQFSHQRLRRVKDLLITQVPFTMKELATNASSEGRDFSMSLARAHSTIAASPDCLNSVLTFLSESLVSHRQRNYCPSVELLHFIIQHDDDLCASFYPLLEILLQSFQVSVGENASTALVHATVSVLKRFFEICPSPDYAKKLAGALEKAPRLLFAARNLRMADRNHLANAIIETVWECFSQLHPAIEFVDKRKYALTLTTLFGFTTASGDHVDGVLASADAAVKTLAASIFLFFEQSSLPAKLPPQIQDVLAVGEQSEPHCPTF